ncbi:hypothetical protein AVEN_12539-1 [Araneus ventricosus]|uniref:Uncharacterized protein n=1 Tax=Araneus ventricosus TaxID=182803 RepID=A0A4Y2TMB8_ARAVE|nr:hypothetical protein AVEN_12539-1 [Araneus ventricosus]
MVYIDWSSSIPSSVGKGCGLYSASSTIQGKGCVCTLKPSTPIQCVGKGCVYTLKPSTPSIVWERMCLYFEAIHSHPLCERDAVEAIQIPMCGADVFDTLKPSTSIEWGKDVFVR